MADILHILNGDSTREMLALSGLEGEVAVWRDVLSDGPAIEKVGSEEFWQARTSYMSQTFGITKEDFEAKAKDEFAKIEQFREYQEVVLWFEYDLFCQINLIALMHWFHGQERGNTKVSLICVGQEEGYDRLVGLGEMKPDHFPDLFARRRIMGTYDFVFTSDAYTAWCSADPTDLDNFILMSSNEFPYLSDALQSHQRRFPGTETGLTEIELKVIELVRSGVTDRRKLVGQLLRWQGYQGFGDLQYFQILDRMAPLFKEGDELELNEESIAQIDVQEPITSISRNYHLGGAQASEWLWDENTNELTSREISSL